MGSLSHSDLECQNRAMRAAYCEDIENYNRYREEQQSRAVWLASRERPQEVEMELPLGGRALS